MLVTPEYKGAELAAFQKSLGLETALVAHDPKNVQKISLKNILQCYVIQAQDGKKARADMRNLVGSVSGQLNLGTHRVNKGDITNEKVLKLWWMLERGRSGAIPLLAKLVKAKGAHQSDAEALMVTVQKAYDDDFAAIQSQGVTIDAFDALESLIIEYTGLNSKKSEKSKSAKKLYKSLSKEKALKKELKARSMWFKVKKMSQSNKPKDREMAKGGAAHIAKKYPDTKYGKIAGDM